MNLETAVFCTPAWGSINASYTEMALRDPKVKRLVCCCSVTQLCPTLCDPTDCSKPSFHVLHHLPELTQTHVHRVGDAIQPSPPLLSPSLPAFDLSQHQGLSQWVSSLHQGPEYWNFSFSISPSNEYSALISFRIDWFDLLDVQGTLKSLPQHHSLKASVLQHSAFFMVQLSRPYMTTAKTIALTRRSYSKLKKTDLALFDSGFPWDIRPCAEY